MCISEERVIGKTGVAEMGCREGLTHNCSFRIKVINQAAHISHNLESQVQKPGPSRERSEEKVVERFVHSGLSGFLAPSQWFPNFLPL